MLSTPAFIRSAGKVCVKRNENQKRDRGVANSTENAPKKDRAKAHKQDQEEECVTKRTSYVVKGIRSWLFCSGRGRRSLLRENSGFFGCGSLSLATLAAIPNTFKQR